ncbi:MAG TPA: hypothetical protein PKJ19_04555 [Flavobacteriales bacterium]|nr:hypothetical protein [Flavobacteriales bacterium]HNU57716.1 hypothetical protein [Flavobacteriales bacterium]
MLRFVFSLYHPAMDHRRVLTAAPLIILLSTAHALVPMPDAALRAWAQATHPGCIVGTSIDETHTGVQSATMIDISGWSTPITDLTGLDAFVSATHMNVSGHPITVWMGPANPLELIAMGCNLSGTFVVPHRATSVRVSWNNITRLDMSQTYALAEVVAHHNQITQLNWGSGTLLQLDLSYNQLNALGTNVPLHNATVDISHNNFTALPALGSQPGWINASWNQISSFTNVPCYHVDLSHNNIQQVPANGFGGANYLDLSYNPLTQGLLGTSYSLQTLYVNNTQLPCLPYLHNALVDLRCGGSPIQCLPNIPAGLNLSQVDLGFAPTVCPATSPCYFAPPSIALRVALQGPYDADTDLMDDDLRAQGLVPATDPYPALGYTYTGAGWPDVFDPAVLAVTGADAIVDWVIVGMTRNNTIVDPGDAVNYSRPALLQRDGDVVALDGTWPLPLKTPRGSYRTSVRHRNHLGAITRLGEWFNGTPVTIDLTRYSATACFAEAMHGDSLISDHRQLWCGDVNQDHKLKYAGLDNDRDLILQAIGGIVPTNTINGVYHRADVNMDGMVKYSGLANDRDPILMNIGGSVPTAIRNQQGFQ